MDKHSIRMVLATLFGIFSAFLIWEDVFIIGTLCFIVYGISILTILYLMWQDGKID